MLFQNGGKSWSKIREILCVLVLIVGFATAHSSQVKPGYIDESFYSGIGTGYSSNLSDINSMELQPDGKFLVAGYLGNGVNGTGKRTRIARFDSQGKLDLSFRDLFLFNGSNLNHISLRTDGKIYAAGGWGINHSGVNSPGMVLLNADGTLNTSFTSPFLQPSQVLSFAIQNDGKIVVVGVLQQQFGSDISVVRLNENGSLDPSFTSFGLSGKTAKHIIVQSDGKMLVAMIDTATNNSKVVRLNSNGTLDTTFDSGIGGNYQINKIVIQNDGKVIIVGAFTQYNGESRNSITRLNSNGTTDSTFNIGTGTGTGANGPINNLKVQADGKILICGNFFEFNGFARNHIARLNSDGSVDTSFTTNPNPNPSYILEIFSLILQNDGKIWLGGEFKFYDGKVFLCLARINSNGSIDGTVKNHQGFRRNSVSPSVPLPGTVNSLLVQSDGRTIVGGEFVSYDGTPVGPNIARLNPDGTLDTTFNTGLGANGPVYTVVSQSDGKIIIAGNFSLYNGASDSRIVRLNSNGSLDTSFSVGIGPNNYILSAVLQTDGKILIGGSFTSINGVTQGRIARLNSNGSLDTSFSTGTGADNIVYKVVLQPNGQILIGGTFSNFNGVGRGKIARLNSNGTLDSSFGSANGVDIGIYALSLQTDGKILIGGNFSNYGGILRTNLARLNSDGTLDISFQNPNTTITVFSIAIQNDSKIVAAGGGGGGMRDIDRFNPDGTRDPTFPSTLGDHYYGYYYDIKLQGDRKILIGGYFSKYDSGLYPITDSYGIERGSILRIFSGLERKPKFDFDGDGSDDLGTFLNGSWSIHQSSSLDKNTSLGISTDKIVPGDFDGDGKADLAVFRPSEGTWYINKSSDSSTYAVYFGLNGDVPQPGDYDGDRKTDVAVWRSSTQYWYILNSSTGQISYVPFGISTDKPVSEDYDGDGKTDVTVFRNGVWWVWQSSNNSVTSYQWGISTDVPTPADYDGDGKCDFAVYRNGTWYLSQSRDGITSFQLGITGDKLVPADFDGDSKTDIAVFRSGTWIIKYTNSGQTSTVFGNSAGLPIPSAFIP